MKLNRHFYLPSLAEMLFLSIFIYLSFGQGTSLLGDGDTGYHIRAGEWIISHLSVPRYDMFSFHTPPLPWTAHEWLSEVLMALIHKVSGLTGIVVFFSFILALTFYLLFRMIRARGGNCVIATIVVLLAVAAASIHWLARPHVFTLLLFVAWYRILEDYRLDSRNRLYLLPPILLLWVNLHGGFLIGLILLGIYLTCEVAGYFTQDGQQRQDALGRAKALSITILACLAVSLINPYGYHMLLFPFDLVANRALMDNVTEFMSPNFHEPSPFKYLLLAMIAVFALSREKLRLVELLLILLFANMALYSVRHIALFSIIAAPILVRHTELLLDQEHGRFTTVLSKHAREMGAIDSSAGGIFWLLAAVMIVVVSVAKTGVHYGFDPKTKPVAAVRFIEKAGIQGNMFNNDEFGDYMIYAAWPRYKVFFDGRSDMYGKKRLDDYRKVMSFKDGWDSTLAGYNINWVFFDADSPLARYLMVRRDWKLIYRDKVAVIFVRNIPQNRMIIEKYGVKTPNGRP